MAQVTDPFGAIRTLEGAGAPVKYFSLRRLAEAGVGPVDRLPISIKVLLEALLRNVDDFIVTQEDVRKLANWNAAKPSTDEIPFMPSRVVLQDFTGVPAVVDLAALREASRELGSDPKKINPLVPCDLVIDHSVQVDHFGQADSLKLNMILEFERNRERYEFLKWGQSSFTNFRVVPPGMGIVHQVNLEYLAPVVTVRDGVALPDSVVGTDSHTTMINGLGVVGWGVGGIEAEAVMLGQPVYMVTPEVVGFRLTGRLPEGATATDLVLTVTQILRKAGVVGQFVEFYGPGVSSMSLPDRATVANMAPEYGATMGFFPVDQVTLDYMRTTGRTEQQIKLVELYCKAQGLWLTPDFAADYTRKMELDMSTIQPSLAGPKRPQDRILLSDMKKQWRSDLDKSFGRNAPASPAGGGGAAVAVAPAPVAEARQVQVEYGGSKFALKDGAVVIAAITSCTNTSNPSVLIAAGLVARNAVQRGLTVKPWVKTSLAPGSRVVTEYLEQAGLMSSLESLHYNLVGYGCTTCIGNSGPLPEPVSKGVHEGDLVVASVLSGNRNFEGRVNPDVRANYLASPPLVVAYALAGTVDIDMATEPLGKGKDGKDVYLRDIWPTDKEIAEISARCVTSRQFTARYADVLEGDEAWRKIPVEKGELYKWVEDSTYIRHPNFFQGLSRQPGKIGPVKGARVLAMVGDSVTTDHISPAGSIKADSPAGKYLQAHGVSKGDFNSYGARRGNHEVMVRGTFANIRLRNQLAPGTEGGVTLHLPDGEPMSIYDAAMKYQRENVPLVVLAGAEYGTGSSRDWAAKGTFLLGVKAVIALSFERIHRSNLVGMGVLPLQYKPGQTAQSLGLSGRELFDFVIDDSLKPGQDVQVIATAPDGKKISFTAICRIDTPVEVEYYRNGGILHTVLRKLASS